MFKERKALLNTKQDEMSKTSREREGERRRRMKEGGYSLKVHMKHTGKGNQPEAMLPL